MKLRSPGWLPRVLVESIPIVFSVLLAKYRQALEHLPRHPPSPSDPPRDP